MTDANTQLINAATTYVTDIFHYQVPAGFVFHSWHHTQRIFETCQRMAEYDQLNEEDNTVLLLSALFHDTRIGKGKIEGHENASKEVARLFLQQQNVGEKIIQRVESCIQATAMPQSPVSQVEKMLCDAVLAHLGSDDFFANNQLLRQEQENVLGRKIGKADWRKSTIAFLKAHRYFTSYGNDLLLPEKEKNLSALMSKGKGNTQKKSKSAALLFAAQTAAQKSKELPEEDAEKGSQTMLRIVSGNHMELSNVADKKANILITVNSIILSLCVHRFVSYSRYLIPTAILALTCLISDTLSILATRPSISSGKFTEEDIRRKRTNLLFFGNFYQMSLQDYQWAMKQMIRDKDYLNQNMIMDSYFLGLVVAKKYRLLRFAYTVFMVGIVVAVLAFALATLSGSGASG